MSTKCKRGREQIPDLSSLKRLKVAELKDLCTELGVRKVGNKADLIASLDSARTVQSAAKATSQPIRPSAPVREVKTPPSAQRSAVPTPLQPKKSNASAFFAPYAMKSDPRSMDLSGFVQFGLDLAGGDEEKASSSEHTALLFLLCSRFKAKSFGRMTLDGFVAGCEQLQCFTLPEVLSRKPAIMAEVAVSKVDPSRRSVTEEKFQQFHSYVFDILRPEGKKYIEKDMAMLALQAIFQGLPGRESPHIELFVRFLNTHDKLVSINSDQWKGFLQFSREVDTSFSGYSDADPWPSMFDDFVSWVKEQDDWKAKYPPKV